MIKYIFSDLDGTLLDDNKEVSKQNLETIKKCEEKGIKFIINTGRLPSTFKDRYSGILDLSSYVAGNGSLIYSNNEKLYSCPLEKEERFKIAEIGLRHGVGPRVYNKNDFNILEGYENEIYLQFFNYKTLSKDKMFDLLENDDIYKMCFSNERKEVLTLIEEDVKKECKETSVTYSSPYFLETNNSKVSKGKGIDVYCKKFNIDYDEVLVMGDNLNDMPMMDYHFHSACPFNAIDEIKNVCEYVSTNDSNNSAVGEIIKHFCNL